MRMTGVKHMWEVVPDYVNGEKLYFVEKDGTRIGTFDDRMRAQEFADVMNGEEE